MNIEIRRWRNDFACSTFWINRYATMIASRSFDCFHSFKTFLSLFWFLHKRENVFLNLMDYSTRLDSESSVSLLARQSAGKLLSRRKCRKMKEKKYEPIEYQKCLTNPSIWLVIHEIKNTNCFTNSIEINTFFVLNSSKLCCLFNFDTLAWNTLAMLTKLDLGQKKDFVN